LRDGNLERCSNPTKPPGSSPLRSSCDLFQKIGTERIASPPNVSGDIPHKLGNKVKVSDGLKESREIAKFPIDVDLLDIGLLQARLISAVLIVRTSQDRAVIPSHQLVLDNRALSIVLIEGEPVGPLVRASSGNTNLNLDVGISSRGEASQLRDAPSLRDRLSEATADINQIVKESHGIQQV
jgi:hypothetical protein